MMLNEQNCTVLVNSCDDYEDLWYPFFKLFEKYWKDCPYPVVLNTESKKYEPSVEFPSNFTTVNSGGGTWSSRLKNVLSEIDSQFIIFMLDDFFLQADVKTEQIEKAMEHIKGDENIGLVYLVPLKNPNTDPIDVSKIGQFVKLNKKIAYCIQCQIALWRKSALMDLLNSEESAWGFEECATRRARKSKWKILDFEEEKAYNSGKAIFPYTVHYRSGYGVSGGKWLWKNEALFQANGLSVDMTKRGTIHSWEEMKKIIDKNNEDSSCSPIREFLLNILPEGVISIIRKIKHKLF